MHNPLDCYIMSVYAVISTKRTVNGKYLRLGLKERGHDNMFVIRFITPENIRPRSHKVYS